jgi:hypothetical protein
MPVDWRLRMPDEIECAECGSTAEYPEEKPRLCERCEAERLLDREDDLREEIQ